MVNVLVLGKQEDCACYAAFAERAEHRVQYIDLKPEQIVQAEQYGISPDLEGIFSAPVDDVISFGDDLQVVVDVIRQSLGLPYRDPQRIKTLSNKALSRQDSRLSGFFAQSREFDLSCSFDNLATKVEQQFTFPVVIKPSNAFYSAGVTRCDNRDELRCAFIEAKGIARVMRSRRGESSILVESYVDGEEFAVDGIIYEGQIIPLMVHQKRPGLKGPKFHEHGMISRHIVNDQPNLERYRTYAQALMSATGLDNSPFHIELRENNGSFYLLEIAPRISGGGTSGYNALRITSGLDFFDIQHAINQRTLKTEDLNPQQDAFSVEFDFGSKESGVLENLDVIVAACKARRACALFSFKKNGEFLRKEGEGFESCLMAYFTAPDQDIAEALFDDIYKNLRIKVFQPAL